MSLSVIWILLAMGAYGVLHSSLASQPAKRMFRKRLGEQTANRYYRLFFNVVGVVTLLPILAMPALLPDTPLYRVPTPWRWLMVAGQAVSAGLVVLAVIQTGALDFLGIKQASGAASAPPRLVTSGLYRLVRHPLYLFTILALWLTPAMTLNLAALFAGATAYFLIGAVYEERRLAAFFGEAYTAYQARTPMVFPLKFK
jgi:protein-S-isoprenylcysteine O-methyltransferase Ste14